MRGKNLHSAVGFGLLLIVAVTLFVTPGYRHAHEGGDDAHSHSHGHSHGHMHRHGRHTHAHKHTSSEQTRPKVAHTHFGFLGFQWALPDVSAMFAETPVTSHGDSAGANESTALLDVPLPWSLGHVIQLLMLIAAARPAAVSLRQDDLTQWQIVLNLPFRGRIADPPATPPPEQT